MTTPFNRVKFTPVAGGTADFVVSAAATGYRTPAQASVPTGTAVSYTAESADKTQWETGVGFYTSATTTLSRGTFLGPVRENSLGDTSKVNFSAPPSVWIDWHAQELHDYRASSFVQIKSARGISGGDETGQFMGFTAGDGVGDGTGGNFELQAGFGAGGGQGGGILQSAGNGGDEGSGGDIEIRGGAGGDVSGNGGGFTVDCGDALGDGDGGAVLFQGGSVSGVGNGGTVDFAGGNALDGPGGTILLDAGDGSSAGGNMEFAGGRATTAGNGGSFELDTGDGAGVAGQGGDIVFLFGTGTARNGLFFPNLPTSNPGVTGAMWNDGGTVKIS